MHTHIQHPDCLKSDYLPPMIEVEEFKTEKGFAQSGTEDYGKGNSFGDWD